MGFFDEVIDDAWLVASARPRSVPEWCRPPGDVRGAPVPTSVDLVRCRDLAVWIGNPVAYPTGISFELHIRWQLPRRVAPPFLPGRAGRNGLCLGAQTDEGQRLLAIRIPKLLRMPEQPGPVLAVSGARHDDDRAIVALWLWAPVGESLTWVFEWRAQRVVETRVAFSLAAFRQAGVQAERLWRGNPRERLTVASGARAG